MENKLSGLLGIAVRARKILFGDSAVDKLASADASLLLISDKASERTLKQLTNRANYYEVEFIIVEDFLLNQATGKTTAKYCLIIDRGFSKGILDIFRKRWRYGEKF